MIQARGGGNVRRKTVGVVLAWLLAAAVLTASATAAPWARVNQVQHGGSLDIPALLVKGASVITAINRHPPSSPTTVDVAQFTPSLTAGAASIQHDPLVPDATPSNSLNDPQLLPGTPPQLFVADPYAGFSLWSLTTPTTATKTLSFGAPYSFGLTSAVVDGGTLFYVRGMTVYSGTSGGAGTDMSPLAAGQATYTPTLGVDTQGHLWLAWAALANDPTKNGLWMLQIDPTTDQPVGVALHAPQSASGINGGVHSNLACGTACRLVYARTGPDNSTATGDIVSWAPGEAAPTRVVSLGLFRITGRIAGAYDASGRLWVAWYANSGGPGDYQAKLGDTRGAGGIVEDLGVPPYNPNQLDGPSPELVAAAYQNGLVVEAVWSHNQSFDLYATFAPPAVSTSGSPNPVVVGDPSGGAVVPSHVTSVTKNRCVLVRVQAYRPATLSVSILTGRTGSRGGVVGRRANWRFAGPGIHALCIALSKKPRGYYTLKHPFHFFFVVHLPNRRVDTSHSRSVTITAH
jgi:hypothetical protein